MRNQRGQLKIITFHALRMSDSLSDLSPCSPTLEPPDESKPSEQHRKGGKDGSRPRKRKHSYLTQKVGLSEQSYATLWLAVWSRTDGS